MQTNNRPSIPDLCRRLRAAREEREALEDRAKAAKAAEETIEATLFWYMQEEDMSNLTLDGAQYVRTTRNVASAIADQKPALYDALRANGRGDIIKETINANTLSAVVNEAIEAAGNALPDWLDGLVNLHAIEHVAIRGR